MNYIYDILLNFHETLYDFYDWNLGDNIINIRKIPLIKIPSNQLKEIKENYIQLHPIFLKKIQNKTELFSSKDIKNIEYCCLLSDGTETIAILNKNNIMKKSHLLIDEELEVLEIIPKIKEETIDYKIIKQSKTMGFKTRKEVENEKMIQKNLKRLKEADDIQQLKYLYYECFNEKEEDKNKILLRLQYALEKNTNSIIHKLSQFFQLIHK